jgi:hypothetical protein
LGYQPGIHLEGLTKATKLRKNLQTNKRYCGDRGSTVVKVLHYKSEGGWFDPRWCHWNSSLTWILLITLWPWGRLSLWQKWIPGVFPGGKCDRCVRLTNLPPSCAVVKKFGNLNFLVPSGPLQACNGTALPFFYKWYCHCDLMQLPSMYVSPIVIWFWSN